MYDLFLLIKELEQEPSLSEGMKAKLMFLTNKFCRNEE